MPELRLRTGVMIGGESRRMGAPKQLIEWRGRPLVAPIVDVLSMIRRPLFLGGGPLPDSLAAEERLADAPDHVGPVAGLIAALRHDAVPWIVCACDMPLISEAALEWLVRARRPDTHAVLPVASGRVQPLFALYEPTALPLLERLPESDPSPRRLVRFAGVVTPDVPDTLERAWRNVNRPEDLAEIDRI